MNRSWIAGFVVLCLTALVPCATAQEKKEPSGSEAAEAGRAADGEEHDHSLEVPPTAGYEKSSGNGFFIRSKDEKFRLNIGLYTQLRYDVNWRDAPEGEEDVEKGFSINRTRFFLEGQFTPRFNYHFRINIDGESDFSLIAAFAQFNIGDKWNVRAGRLFLASSREDWMLPQDTLTTEFSPNDFTFASGASTGVQAHYQGARQRLWAAVSDGTPGAKRDFPSSEPSEVSLTGRWELQVTGNDWSVWDDLIGRRGRPQGILLGLAGGYLTAPEGSEFDAGAQMNADVSFNGDGYQVMLAGSWTWKDAVAADSFSNYGLVLQGGYFLTEEVQVYAQYNLVSPGDQPGDLDSFNSVTAGASYYPFSWTNRWKFSAEAGHLFDALNATIVQPSGSLGWLASDEEGQTYFRVQAQFGF